MNPLIQTIGEIQELLAVCPCCGEIFRLVESKFIFPQSRPQECGYLELVAAETKYSEEADRLDAAEERFEESLERRRTKLREEGRRLAKSKIRNIDPTFSAKNIDPQDVKVIFDPVEYLIFHGLKSGLGVNLVEFVSRLPSSKTQERTVKSIDRTIRNGNVEFETLQMKDDGSFEIRKAELFRTR
jgi:predicted Holliday junction resolvase-like endonuclease